MHVIGATLETFLLAVGDRSPSEDHSLLARATPKFEEVSLRLRSFAHVALSDCCRVLRVVKEEV